MEVLIADHDSKARETLKNLLEELDYTVASVSDGHSAWNALRRHDVRLAIADADMPGTNGQDLCRKIRSAGFNRYVYVILTTAKKGREDLVAGLESGADDYIVKPFNRAELRARLHAARRVVELERELSSKNRMLEDLNGRLETMALTDPLLEIPNRRALYDTLNRISTRHGYALLVCDVDDFKSYNDLYGHLAGDRALKSIAEALAGGLRATDRLFRYGGEEVVAVLPDADIEAAHEVAERLCKTVEELYIEHRASPGGFVTISCGVAACSNEETCRDWEPILSMADMALYCAKVLGKNRAEVALSLLH